MDGGEYLATEQEEPEAGLANVEEINQQGTTDGSEEGSKTTRKPHVNSRLKLRCVHLIYSNGIGLTLGTKAGAHPRDAHLRKKALALFNLSLQKVSICSDLAQ